MLSDDTNSLRHLPRRSSKNCDLQFAISQFDISQFDISIHLFCSMFAVLDGLDSNELAHKSCQFEITCVTIHTHLRCPDSC